LINIIAAVDKNMGIGKGNDLLISLKSDMEHFVRTTSGQVVVMGYKTYLSLKKKPLPNRVNIVLTTRNIKIDGAIVVHNVEELSSCLHEYTKDKEIFIIGGASVFMQLLPYTEKLYITHIFEIFDADTYFPGIDDNWELESVSCTKDDLLNEHPHVFAIYKRKDTSQLLSLG
jgi:dihydrofolate reductase